MTTTTHPIHETTCDSGEWHQMNLWADGNGQECEGYVTSLSQLRAEMREHLSYDLFDLYYVTKEGKCRKISNEKRLKEAVELLPDKELLSLTAVRQEPRTTLALEVGKEMTDAPCSCCAQRPAPKASKKKVHFNTHVIERNKEKVNAIVERFNVAPLSVCYYCDKPGSYSYVLNDDYYACAECCAELSSSEKKNWVYYSAWKSTVPKAPLSREYTPKLNDEVRDLQYLLTRLGLMPLSATSIYVGSYQKYAERAVQTFREMHQIVDEDMGEYNKKTVTVLSRVIRQFRKEGHPYL